LQLACRAISDSGLFRRSVLTLHNDQREIINLGQHGLDPGILEQARKEPAPDRELSNRMTEEKFRISRSFFIPAESGLIHANLKESFISNKDRRGRILVESRR